MGCDSADVAPCAPTSDDNKLTVIIPCKNEREHIGACIRSAQQVADEVLVADSGSTDGTLEIARELGCRIIEREYRTSGDFKNWAIPQAAHEWVLILDADERMTLAAGRRNSPRAGPTRGTTAIGFTAATIFWATRFASARGRTTAACGCFAATWAATSARPIMPKSNLTSGTVGRLRRAADALHVHFLRAVSAKAGSLRRRAGANLAQPRSAARRWPFAAALSAAILARLRVAARVSRRPGRPAGLRAGGVPVVFEARVPCGNCRTAAIGAS